MARLVAHGIVSNGLPVGTQFHLVMDAQEVIALDQAVRLVGAQFKVASDTQWSLRLRQIIDALAVEAIESGEALNLDSPES